MSIYSSSSLISFVVASVLFSSGNIHAMDKAGVGTSLDPISASFQRVFLDPATGQVRAPTRQEIEALQKPGPSREGTKSSSVAKIVQFSDGAVGVYMQRPKNILQVKISKNRQVETYCNDGPAQKIP